MQLLKGTDDCKLVTINTGLLIVLKLQSVT
jgi:hypothetical protein